MRSSLLLGRRAGDQRHRRASPWAPLPPSCTLSKSFNMPITQVSQQFNFIVMALAGAERIFDLMDEEPEIDEGYVTLVNAKFDPERPARGSRGATPASGPGRSPPGGRQRRLMCSSRAMCGSTMWTSATIDGQDRPARHQPLCQTRPEDRLCRRHRCRQDHDHQPDQPVLRYCRRQDSL